MAPMMKNGSEPMIAAEALASWLTRADLLLHPLAVAQHLREIVERLGEIAASLRLDGHDDSEEIDLGERHAVEHALDALVDGDAHPLALDDLEEFRADRAGSRAAMTFMASIPAGRPSGRAP